MLVLLWGAAAGEREASAEGGDTRRDANARDGRRCERLRAACGVRRAVDDLLCVAAASLARPDSGLTRSSRIHVDCTCGPPLSVPVCMREGLSSP